MIAQGRTHVNMAEIGHLVTLWVEEWLPKAGIPSRRQLCLRSGVARSTLDALEDGTRRPDQRTLDKLAAILGTEPPRVVTEVGLAFAGGPPDAQTPRQALTLAKRAIEQAERLLDVPTPPDRAAGRSLDAALGDLSARQESDGAGRRGSHRKAGT